MARNRIRACRNVVNGLILPVTLSACLIEDPVGQPESNNPLLPTGINNAPEIWGNAPSTAKVGVAYSFTPQATDPDADPLSFSINNKPIWLTFDSSIGRIAGVPQPRDEGAYADIAISVTDGLRSTSLPAFSIGVAAENVAPVAEDDSYTTVRDTPLNVAAPGLLVNDSDADGDPLTAMLVSDVSNGTLTLNADGSFEYTPTDGFEGTDSFSVVANDGLLDSEAATVNLIVNVPANATPFVCSQVIGFSQTAQWYRGESDTGLTGFEAIVDNDHWQLLFHGGSGVEEWSDPNYPGWDEPLIAQCVDSADKPDRVILTISGDLPKNEPQVWADEIDRAITTITLNYDSVRQVLLQPVVGGPNDSVCTLNDRNIRASVNHPTIDQAIELVVTNHSVDVIVAAGFSPTVAACSDYRDTPGHLIPTASDSVGQEIGLFYVDH